jgi:hypothetical protein
VCICVCECVCGAGPAAHHGMCAQGPPSETARIAYKMEQLTHRLDVFDEITTKLVPTDVLSQVQPLFSARDSVSLCVCVCARAAHAHLARVYIVHGGDAAVVPRPMGLPQAVHDAVCRGHICRTCTLHRPPHAAPLHLCARIGQHICQRARPQYVPHTAQTHTDRQTYTSTHMRRGWC